VEVPDYCPDAFVSLRVNVNWFINFFIKIRRNTTIDEIRFISLNSTLLHVSAFKKPSSGKYTIIVFLSY
jgi:hypothetical protein